MKSRIPPFLRHCLFRLFLVFLICEGAATMQPTGSDQDPLAKYMQPAYLFDQSALYKDTAALDLISRLEARRDERTPLQAQGYQSGEYQLLEIVDQPESEQSYIDALTKLQDAAEACYRTRRVKLCLKALGQETLGAILFPALFLGAIPVANQLGVNNNIIVSLLMYNAVIFFGMKIPALQGLITTMMIPSNDPLTRYEIRYARVKIFLNYLDRAADSKKKEEDPYYAPPPENMFLVARQGKVNILPVMTYFDTLLSVPIKSKKPRFDLPVLKRLLSPYAPAEGEKILMACINHVKQYSPFLGVNPRTREFLNLVSPPGTGKSSLPPGLVRCVGIPHVLMSLGGITPESFLGTAEYPGLFLLKLCELGYRNGAILFDELYRVAADPILQAIILPLLDPNTKTIYFPYLQRTADISHLLIMAASNHLFDDPAFKDRFNPRKSVDLKIVDQDAVVTAACTGYLYEKMVGNEYNETTDLHAGWIKNTREALEGQEFSFRILQAALDQSIARWRLSREAELIYEIM